MIVPVNMLYIALKHTHDIPPEKIRLSPIMIDFKTRMYYSTLDDKKDDDINMARVACYKNIERAIELYPEENKIGLKLDIYQPIDSNDILKGYCTYDYLIKRGLIKNKGSFKTEEWFTEPINVRYIGSIKVTNTNPIKYKFIVKDYEISDLGNDIKQEYVYNENILENEIARKRLRDRNAIYLYNCTTDKMRIIMPDQINYPNRIRRKEKYSSFWYADPFDCIMDYVKTFLINNDTVGAEDLTMRLDENVDNRLFILNTYKDEVFKVLSNLRFYLNIIKIPDHGGTGLAGLDSDYWIGLGWDRFDRAYTYDNPIRPEEIREIHLNDYLENLAFTTKDKINKINKTNKVFAKSPNSKKIFYKNYYKS